MKKIILLLLILSTSVFGYYSSDAMIDLLVQSNQLRVRTDRVGALFGNENVRAAIGLTGANSLSGIIVHNVNDFDALNNAKKGLYQFVPAVLGAIGYDSDLFGIGFGYEFKWKDATYMVHTPIITLTALEDTFRINIPVSVGVGQRSYYNRADSLKGTMVISTGIEARYYFNMEYFSHLRFYLNYGNSTIKEISSPSTNFTQQSVGFQARAYFNYDFSYYKITPIIRFQFDMALATKFKNITRNYNIVDNYFITAKGFTPVNGAITEGSYGSSGANADVNTRGELRGGYIASIPNTYYAEEPYRIGVAVPVGFRTVSESGTIELYVEPALSLTIVNAKRIYSFSQAMQGLENLTENDRRKAPFLTFGYVVYGELYIRPRPRLEWYTEIQTGGATVAGELANTSGSTSLIFNASTGITWYF
ncbi:cell surface protein [Brachyspira aalborgi]|uniref:cell surface protein n=1 Tax=Brachyspira aalborgi TaxID=29522 RepID=UPI0011C79F43|nr:cell surface protein [Brachyspira aalborgi]TXJ50910.1 cell surface protein [Brachyspira aalborgi]